MEDGLEPDIALLQYRNTPVSGLKYSPAQLLMSRRLKDKLPSTSVLLAPQVVTNAQNDLRLLQQRQKHYYDRGTKPQPPFGPGDHVQVRLNKTWDDAIVTDKHPAPRSYYITTENGAEYRRNFSSINPSPDPAYVVPTMPSSGAGAVSAPYPMPTMPTAGETSGDPEPVSHQLTPAAPRRSQRTKTRPKWHDDYVVKS